jgi:DNA-binding CsgD family transcriptional regulator
VTFPRAGSVVSRLCQRALAYPELDNGQRARLLAQLAVMAADAGQVDRAVEPARRSLELAAVSGDPHAEIEAARARELTLVHPDDVAERLRLGDLVADRAEALGQPLAAVIAHEWRIAAGYLTGRLDTVDSASAAIEELANRVPLPIVKWHRYRMLASRAVLAGRFADSVEYSGRANEVARASGDLTAAGVYFAHGVYVATVRGDPAALPRGIDEAFATAPQIPLVDVQRANALALRGSVREAREAYDRVRAMLPLPTDHPAWAAVLIQLVDLVERFEDTATAEIAYGQLLPFRPYPGALGTATAFFTGSVSRHLGQFAAVAGKPEVAIELLREALQRNQAIGAPPDTALASLSLARALRGRGDLVAAAGLAQDALTIATRLDMPGPVAAAGRLAADIARDRDEADPLTSREREIAALVAKALTNRQIAAKLVLSERTVESHVRSILAKTQCANRTEFVARWVGV